MMMAVVCVGGVDGVWWYMALIWLKAHCNTHTLVAAGVLLLGAYYDTRGAQLRL